VRVVCLFILFGKASQGCCSFARECSIFAFLFLCAPSLHKPGGGKGKKHWYQRTVHATVFVFCASDLEDEGDQKRTSNGEVVERRG